MKVMLVHPGASFSTHDVYVGMRAGLIMNGVEVVEFRLDEMLGAYDLMLHAADQAGVQWDKTPSMAGLAAASCTAMTLWHNPDALIAVSGHNLHMVTPLTVRAADAWNRLATLRVDNDAQAQAKERTIAMLREVGLDARLDIPTAVYCTESPYFGDFEAKFASAYDVVFTNERRATHLFRHNRVVEYLPHAYNPELHQPGAVEDDYRADVFFVGSHFPERRALFAGVDWTGINFVRRGVLLDDSGKEDILPNSEAVRYYRSSKITLNHHRTTKNYGTGDHVDAGEVESLNPRDYEVPACGGFMLSDDARAELFDVFGDSVPTFRAGSWADLERQVRYWLSHDDAREQAQRAQYEAVQPHHWGNRIKRVLEVVLNHAGAKEVAA